MAQEKTEKPGEEKLERVEVPNAVTYVEMLVCRRTSVEHAMPSMEAFQARASQRFQVLPPTEAQTYIARKQAREVDKKKYDAFFAERKKEENEAMGISKKKDGWK